MIIPHPNSVTFDGLPIIDVAFLLIDQHATRELIEWSDGGPHPVFADIVERRTTITLIRTPSRAEPALPAISAAGELTLVFSDAGTNTDAARKRLTATCVVREIASPPTGPAGIRQSISLIALSSDGASDPIVIQAA